MPMLGEELIEHICGLEPGVYDLEGALIEKYGDSITYETFEAIAMDLLLLTQPFQGPLSGKLIHAFVKQEGVNAEGQRIYTALMKREV